MNIKESLKYKSPTQTVSKEIESFKTYPMLRSTICNPELRINISGIILGLQLNL